MGPQITKKTKYFFARMGSMYPLYALAIFFGIVNLIVSCRPSTFRDSFSWHADVDDRFQKIEENDFFCEGTPGTPHSFWLSLISTIVVYATGLTVTPFWYYSWWIAFYLWFIAIYFQCLAVFPVVYNWLHQNGRKKKLLLNKSIVILLVLNFIILTATWFASRDKKGYGYYTVESNEDVNVDATRHNIAVLGFYLFSPFWILYFVIGMVLAFIYDAYKPSESHSTRKLGHVADGCTLAMLTLFAILISQGNLDGDEDLFFRPDKANEAYLDSESTYRLWSNLAGRMVCPLTTLWIYCLSTGQGYTANMLRSQFLTRTLAPNSYGCFLFHQMVSQ